jgi:molecular chaperone Hsp31 and glyoxalase 3
VNSEMTGGTHRDRYLLTGDSPLASNSLGKMAAETLLEDVAKRS